MPKLKLSGIGSIIGGGLSAIGNMYSVHKQNQAIKWSLAAQAAENEKTLLYNLRLAQMQNQWNIAQWERENEYNSPAAQKARLKAAGLNADMMYGQGALSNVAASSPQLTSGAPASPMDWSSLANQANYGNVVNSFLDTQMKQAQIDNMNADTKKKGAETSILSSDASFRDAYNQGILDTQQSLITLQGKQGDLSDQQVKESMARITQINSTVSNIQANTDQIRNAISNDNARLDLEKLLNSAQVKKLIADTKVSEAQVVRMVKEWEKLSRSYDDQHEISLSQNAKLIVEGNNLRLEGKMTYGAYDSELSIWENLLKILNQITTFVLPFIKK